MSSTTGAPQTSSESTPQTSTNTLNTLFPPDDDHDDLGKSIREAEMAEREHIFYSNDDDDDS